MDQYIPLKVILPITSIGIMMTAMDGSIVNVSLFTIATELNTDINGVRWVVIAYLLVLTSCIGIAGALGDSYGRKKIFQSGMVLFAFASLMCSLASNLDFLIFARVIQGIGAAGIQANGLAIVITYINPSHRGRAIGINSLVVAAALSIGPVLGGVLTELFGWPSIFWINIPLGIVGFIAVQIVIKETESSEDVQLDYRGMVLFTLTSFAFITGLTFIFDGVVFAYFLLPIAFVVAFFFVRHEIGHANPILSIRVMKKRQIMFGALAAIFAYMGINAIMFLLPFYFQDILNATQSTTGLYLVVVPLALSITGPVAGYVAERVDRRAMTTFGISVQMVLMVLLGLAFIILRKDVKLWQILLLMGLSAMFISIFTNANGTSIMNAAEKGELSIISGVIQLARNIGFTLGTALSSAIFTIFRGDDFTSTEVFVTALGNTYLIFAVFLGFGIVFSATRGTEEIITY